MATSSNLLYNGTGRLSWMLVEVDGGQVSGGKTSGTSHYRIVHTMQLESPNVDMTMNRRVRMTIDRTIMEGRIEEASNQRCHLEDKLKLLSQVRIAKQQTKQRYLVQYKSERNTVVHGIFPQSEIIWPTGDFVNTSTCEVMIRDKGRPKIAKVLHMSESDDLMQAESELLREQCFHKFFMNRYDSVDIRHTPWILIQYSVGIGNQCYAVINVQDSIWQSGNEFPNVVAYIGDENAVVHQAIILRKSKDRNILANELCLLEKSCLATEFPLSGKNCFKVPLPSSEQPKVSAKPSRIVRKKRQRHK